MVSLLWYRYCGIPTVVSLLWFPYCGFPTVVSLQYFTVVTYHLIMVCGGEMCRERGKSTLTLLAHTSGTKPVATTKPGAALCWCDW